MSLLQPNGFNPNTPPQPNGFIPNTPPQPTTGMRGHTSHSNNSYGPVFIVLAVVFGVSLFACLLGRLCARKFSHGKDSQRAHFNRPKDEDLENGHRGGFMRGQASHNGENPVFNHVGNGEIREEIRPHLNEETTWVG